MARTTHSFLAWLLLASIARAEIPRATPGTGPNPLVWDAMEKHSELPAMTNLAYFTFWVTNSSTADVTILSTETSCDCTVAESKDDFPWRIGPGENGPLTVRVNTLGNFGTVTRTVAVQSSHGTQVLTARVKIPLRPAPFNVSVRQQDVMVAKADRQAVFRDRCASCHAWPAVGQTGEALFNKVCGICHNAEHRAEMVPDLAALNHETSADFWRTNIAAGKAGSLMPAFAKSAGGILEGNQIESLVEYLLTKYPSRNTVSGGDEAVAAEGDRASGVTSRSPSMP